jgi:hypothetical protein
MAYYQAWPRAKPKGKFRTPKGVSKGNQISMSHFRQGVGQAEIAPTAFSTGNLNTASTTVAAAPKPTVLFFNAHENPSFVSTEVAQCTRALLAKSTNKMNPTISCCGS